MTFRARYGPWAVVAGASTGLGAAFAAEAASRGQHVLLIARRTEVMAATASDLRQRFEVEVRTATVDLADPEARASVAAATADLDVGLFVYNAAAEPQGPFIESSDDDLLRNIDVNCSTPTMLTLDVAKGMVERGRGGIVLVSSMGALQGIKVFVAYGAAKAYELILGEGLWDELRDFGVDAFSYVVGATATPNFIENAAKLSPDPDVLAAVVSDSGQAVSAPRSCEEVAAALFAVLDADRADIGPRHYSHPDDEALAFADAARPRADVVSSMGRMTSALWK